MNQEQKDTIREEIIKALETKKPIQDIVLDFYQKGAKDKVEEVRETLEIYKSSRINERVICEIEYILKLLKDNT